jgi:hypothetical protein
LLEELRQLMVMATVAWNLPLYEQRRNLQTAAHRPTFDTMMEQAPSDREVPLQHSRLGFVDVVEDGDDRAQIVAMAALTDDVNGAGAGPKHETWAAVATDLDRGRGTDTRARTLATRSARRRWGAPRAA